ncbi:hypothetical protein [Amaricoccus sp.]|uniref:hypothetical protein n=1 Tax=Amaricoccus sp. TaxID=1872485 RepID=UPI001B3DEC5E|nr:hypothetical protein [Amaricoccus sp.]MBP7003105.1 hypothetical protein [Amaricoccus sp.]
MTPVLSRAAAALALALMSAPAALAQAETAEAVLDQMAALGVEVEGLVLTEDQVLRIESVLDGTDGDEAKVAEIEKILAE